MLICLWEFVWQSYEFTGIGFSLLAVTEGLFQKPLQMKYHKDCSAVLFNICMSI